MAISIICLKGEEEEERCNNGRREQGQASTYTKLACYISTPDFLDMPPPYTLH
ncbi:hypothetical protein J6590_060100 [Homalodisca vitripennis]|nr:hypothetical protein J6590_060100 [Homalodisca vitripennis]